MRAIATRMSSRTVLRTFGHALFLAASLSGAHCGSSDEQAAAPPSTPGPVVCQVGNPQYTSPGVTPLPPTSCVEPIVPEIWQFSRPVVADRLDSLLVLTANTWEAIAGGVGADVSLLNQRAHVLVEAFDCDLDVLGQPTRIDSALFNLEGGFACDEVAAARAYRLSLGAPLAPWKLGLPVRTSESGIAGAFNLKPTTRMATMSPPAARSLVGASAKRSLLLVEGAISTMRFEPNSEGTVFPGAPPGWSCSGAANPAPAAGVTSATITAVVFDQALDPLAGVELRVCNTLGEVSCRDPGTPPSAVSAVALDGPLAGRAVAKIQVPVGPSGFNGYIHVSGSPRRKNTTPLCP